MRVQVAAVKRLDVTERMTVSLARCEDEVREAQRLRFQVFGEELGARLQTDEPGIDCDLYDRWCDHLIVREPTAGRVVGTYRLLHPAAARRLGGFYSDEEFDLTRLGHLRGQILELGRTCVHRDYRNGVVISLLWSGVARYLSQHHCNYLIGCTSVSMADGGATAVAVHHELQQKCPTPIEYQVFPRLELPDPCVKPLESVTIPPLIKAYVRLGAYVCGAPAWDPEFNTADLLMLLPVSRLTPRYQKYIRANLAAA
jgi:putative hemolysin